MNLKKTGLAAVLAAAGFTPFLFADDLEEAAVALYAINKSGIDISRALDIAEQKIAGVVYEYELDEHDELLVHEFEIADFEAEKKYKIKIAVNDGSVVEQSDEKMKCGKLVCKDDDGKSARALQASEYSLRKALTQLELPPRQLLLEAELEFERGVRYMKLEVVGPDGERDILVDIATGQIIPSLSHTMQ
ncbi:PepSY domain-containing protein [Kineobactrum salinum]|uniref:PepSY domain-containing protein n=1 Tax=Kineobactrum salinum TaxID=2708301 RepID=A0A6C0TXC1_9GAMM|nr:PepSY domain-containing protein [Kineobactrum salinum]QIB64278.1 hypothetical protein G3T16_01520 [Kineobactrum salinum]